MNDPTAFLPAVLRHRAAGLFFSLLAWLLPLAAAAQLVEPTRWSFATSKPAAKVGEEVELIFSVKIIPDWYLYSSDFDPNLGPIVTTVEFEKHPSFQLVGGLVPQHPKKKFDDTWGGEYTYFVGTAEFRQKVKLLAAPAVIKGKYDGQSCSEKSGQCVPLSGKFSFDLKVSGAAPATPTTDKARPATGSTTPAAPPIAATNEPAAPATTEVTPNNNMAPPPPVTSAGAAAVLEASRPQPTVPAGQTTVQAANPRDAAGPALGVSAGGSLWGILLTAFGAGLIALLTPCVYPMVPMTVSYFTSGGDSRGRGIAKALFYGLSIILIYTILGVLVARLLGEDGPNFLSTHWLPNMIFFAVFVVFGLSFLGLFEITLPSALVNRADAKADQGGWLGVFFMACTLVLVSFSCTGPVMGSVLGLAARGHTLAPVVGMFGFSLAFALPFTLFAVFPSWLKSLPRSGGWLNAVKVSLGFLELALSLKFLSVADQVYHWHLLDRDVFLALWIVLFGLLGFYLLGKIRLSHDSEMNHLSVPRLLLASATLAFTVYLIPGLFGAPLSPLAGFLPPTTTLPFDLTAQSGGTKVPAATAALPTTCEAPRYADFLKLPHGLQGYFDLEQARRCAREQRKPIFIDFTGHGCVNCREMEARVWSQPDVLRRLQNDFVVVALYVDDKTELPAAEHVKSTRDGEPKTTVGARNFDLQITRFNANAQPLYVLLSPDDDRVLVAPRAYDLDTDAFVKFLDAGLAAYRTGVASR